MHKTKGQKTFIYLHSGVVRWLCKFQRMMPPFQKKTRIQITHATHVSSHLSKHCFAFSKLFRWCSSCVLKTLATQHVSDAANVAVWSNQLHPTERIGSINACLRDISRTENIKVLHFHHADRSEISEGPRSTGVPGNVPT